VTGQADADALARRSLVEACALWSLDVTPSEAIVDATTDALVAGLDSQSLRVLAGTVPAAAAIRHSGVHRSG
jgi:hypothetical protein